MPKKSEPKNPLASPLGRQFLARHLAEAERVLAFGPGDTGWRHNESLRAETEEGVAFLRALLATLPK
jgi:hypothetical protein